MLVMVVLLTMVSLVERSVLMYTIVLVLPAGPLVLLYHTSYYSRRGGDSSSGYNCGAFYVIDSVGAYSAGWSLGAALSFGLHIILFVVVVLSMVHIVELFQLLLMLVLVMVLGTLALLCRCTHYTLRGGASSNGAACGVFCVLGGNSAGAYWYSGAAISFKIKIYL